MGCSTAAARSEPPSLAQAKAPSAVPPTTDRRTKRPRLEFNGNRPIASCSYVAHGSSASRHQGAFVGPRHPDGQPIHSCVLCWPSEPNSCGASASARSRFVASASAPGRSLRWRPSPTSATSAGFHHPSAQRWQCPSRTAIPPPELPGALVVPLSPISLAPIDLLPLLELPPILGPPPIGELPSALPEIVESWWTTSWRCSLPRSVPMSRFQLTTSGARPLSRSPIRSTRFCPKSKHR